MTFQTPPHRDASSQPLPPVLHAAKWPPDDVDDDSSGTPGAPAGGGFGGGASGGGGFGGGSFDPDEGNFKKGRTKPAIVAIALLAVVGGVAATALAIKGESEKLTVEDIAREKTSLLLLTKDQALPKWREWAAQDKVPELRQEAFLQLAWAKDPEGIDLIANGLTSNDHRIRGTAATALLEYGPMAERAKPALLKALEESDASDKPQIAWALAVLKETAAFDTIFAEYRAGHLAKVQRLDGAPAFDPEVLAQLSSLDQLAGMTGDESASVRQLVATALSKSADPKWATPLIALVRDSNLEVAREAAVGLGKIANEASMQPLLEALSKAEKDTRTSFLQALRDGVGGKGLVLALRSVEKTTAEREKHQTKVIFDMLREIEDPRVGDALVEYLATEPKPHWRTEAAMRMAEVGDLRAAPHLGWRIGQDPLKLYNQIDDPEFRVDDNERVVAARMLADLAILHPESHDLLLRDAESQVMDWITSKPQPHANGLRFLVAAESKAVLPKLRAWANPGIPLPAPAASPPMPLAWETAQSGLRYLGWAKDAQSWGLLEKQLNRQGDKKYDLTTEGLQGSGLAVLGMTLHALHFGAADGFAQWGDPKIYPTLVRYIEDDKNNEHSRQEACFAVAWASTDENMKEVAGKVRQLTASDPATARTRRCYLETLIRRPVPEATATLVELLKPEVDLDVRHQAARAIGMGGVTADVAQTLLGKMDDKALRSDAALALLIGGDAEIAQRALARYNDADDLGTMDELKEIYNGSFGYWSAKNYTDGDVARWVQNADAAGRVKVKDALQDWPKQLLTRALQGDFDNGPRSMTRVQLRVNLYRDAKGSDAKKQAEAIQILKFMKEKGVLMALRSEPGAWQEAARQAFFEVMNPKIMGGSLPEPPPAK